MGHGLDSALLLTLNRRDFRQYFHFERKGIVEDCLALISFSSLVSVRRKIHIEYFEELLTGQQ